MGKTYKGLAIPNMSVAKLVDFSNWYEPRCLSADVNVTELCSGIECVSCIFNSTSTNRDTAMEYLVENGYMTEGKALQLTLDIKDTKG